MFVGWNIIWGVILILLGLSVLIKALFGIDIPLLKMLFGLILIYLGFSIVTDFSDSSIKKKLKQQFNFKNESITITNPQQYEKYTVMFGQGLFDFSHLDPNMEPTSIKLRTIFGQSTLIVNPRIPIRISINSSFGNLELPDQTTASFGDFIYKTDAAYATKPVLEIKVTVVFGNLRIQESK